MIVALLAILFQDVAPQSEILDRAIQKLSESTAHLRKYTCLETVERAYYTDRSRKPGKSMTVEAPPDSCNGAAFGHNDHLHLDSEDRLRLQVAVAGGEEIDSWANASRFDSRSIFELIPDGPRSTGAFGTALVNIFRNPGTQYTYLGRKMEGSRAVFEYSFTVSLETSHYFIDVRKQWRKIAYHGSFELDATAAELVRLTSETPELTLETQMCLARTVTKYHLAPVGEGQYLVPSRSELDVISPGARETHSLSTFAACHEYAAESNLTFDGEIPAATAAVTPKTVPLRPAGLSLTLALAAPIDLSIAAAGDAVTARVVKAVRARGSNEILIAAGAIVHGRLVAMRLERRATRCSLRFPPRPASSASKQSTVVITRSTHLPFPLLRAHLD